MQEKKFNKQEYDKIFHKENYKQFSARLKNDDYNNINNLLSNLKLNKTQFILLAAKHIEEILSKENN